jgi:hypothetical protein
LHRLVEHQPSPDFGGRSTQARAAHTATATRKVRGAGTATAVLQTRGACAASAILQTRGACTASAVLQTRGACTASAIFQTRGACAASAILLTRGACTASAILQTRGACTASAILQTRGACTASATQGARGAHPILNPKTRENKYRCKPPTVPSKRQSILGKPVSQEAIRPPGVRHAQHPRTTGHVTRDGRTAGRLGGTSCTRCHE